MKKTYYLGIDLGTSSVKGVLRAPDKTTVKARCYYRKQTPAGWQDGVRALIAELTSRTEGEIAAVALSSQVGTYVVNSETVIPWNADIGKAELDRIRTIIPESVFLEEIGMPHPALISYPLPRLLYIQEHIGETAEVRMPKELLLHALTGQTVTDVFSMRGLAHPEKGMYADGILRTLGIKLALPSLKSPTALAGHVTAEAAALFGLKSGTPVYLGCNDFFAGLLGMGVLEIGDFFDLSGTSEHIGYLSDEINKDGFVSGGYFHGVCTYGGTKASGMACDLAIRNFGIEGLDLSRALAGKPPIFLPYLCGERAPIFDENARGVFFGLDGKTDTATLSYSTLEGVVFSLYDIADRMHAPKPRRLVCGGGSARDSLMNRLRATLFDCEAVSVAENDTSALGACMLAMVGDGVYPDLEAAIAACVEYLPAVCPEPMYRERLLKRFAVYRELYSDLKPSFERFNKI